MEINIGEIVSNVRAVDSHSVLSPRTMQQIVSAVLEAIRLEERHRRQVNDEQQITAGVRSEMEGNR
jgi:hypothetical protein